MLKLLIFSTFCVCITLAAQPEELFAWNELEFQWPDANTKNAALQARSYIPENNLPLGVEKWNNKLFVTVPRWKAGVASSLNYVQLPSDGNKKPALIPYPNWKSNTLPKNETNMIEPDQIISVFRVRVDACDRLWVMDTGLADILGDPTVYAPPALAIFDLNTDKLIKRYEFKPTDLKEDSFFANVVVDVTPDKCDDAFAYVPDLGGYGIVVYSLKDNNSWRVKHNFFHFDPLKGDFNVGGVNFQWTDGVFGLALSGVNPDGFRTLYFHALAATKQFSVSTEVMRNESIATDPHSYFLFKLEGEKGEMTQASASDVDEKSEVLFMTQLNRDGVACWNTKKPMNPENLALVVQDKEKFIFTNDLKVDKDRNLYILSDRMPTFIYQQLNSQEVNYRIFKISVAEAIKGTVCEK